MQYRTYMAHIKRVQKIGHAPSHMMNVAMGSAAKHSPPRNLSQT